MTKVDKESKYFYENSLNEVAQISYISNYTEKFSCLEAAKTNIKFRENERATKKKFKLFTKIFSQFNNLSNGHQKVVFVENTKSTKLKMVPLFCLNKENLKRSRRDGKLNLDLSKFSRSDIYKKNSMKYYHKSKLSNLSSPRNGKILDTNSDRMSNLSGSKGSPYKHNKSVSISFNDNVDYFPNYHSENPIKHTNTRNSDTKVSLGHIKNKPSDESDTKDAKQSLDAKMQLTKSNTNNTNELENLIDEKSEDRIDEEDSDNEDEEVLNYLLNKQNDQNKILKIECQRKVSELEVDSAMEPKGSKNNIINSNFEVEGKAILNDKNGENDENAKPDNKIIKDKNEKKESDEDDDESDDDDDDNNNNNNNNKKENKNSNENNGKISNLNDVLKKLKEGENFNDIDNFNVDVEHESTPKKIKNSKLSKKSLTHINLDPIREDPVDILGSTGNIYEDKTEKNKENTKAIEVIENLDILKIQTNSAEKETTITEENNNTDINVVGHSFSNNNQKVNIINEIHTNSNNNNNDDTNNNEVNYVKVSPNNRNTNTNNNTLNTNDISNKNETNNVTNNSNNTNNTTNNELNQNNIEIKTLDQNTSFKWIVDQLKDNNIDFQVEEEAFKLTNETDIKLHNINIGIYVSDSNFPVSCDLLKDFITWGPDVIKNDSISCESIIITNEDHSFLIMNSDRIEKVNKYNGKWEKDDIDFNSTTKKLFFEIEVPVKSKQINVSHKIGNSENISNLNANNSSEEKQNNQYNQSKQSEQINEDLTIKVNGEQIKEINEVKDGKKIGDNRDVKIEESNEIKENKEYRKFKYGESIKDGESLPNNLKDNSILENKKILSENNQNNLSLNNNEDNSHKVILTNNDNSYSNEIKNIKQIPINKINNEESYIDDSVSLRNMNIYNNVLDKQNDSSKINEQINQMKNNNDNNNDTNNYNEIIQINSNKDNNKDAINPTNIIEDHNKNNENVNNQIIAKKSKETLNNNINNNTEEDITKNYEEIRVTHNKEVNLIGNEVGKEIEDMSTLNKSINDKIEHKLQLENNDNINNIKNINDIDNNHNNNSTKEVEKNINLLNKNKVYKENTEQVSNTDKNKDIGRKNNDSLNLIIKQNIDKVKDNTCLIEKNEVKEVLGIIQTQLNHESKESKEKLENQANTDFIYHQDKKESLNKESISLNSIVDGKQNLIEVNNDQNENNNNQKEYKVEKGKMQNDNFNLNKNEMTLYKNNEENNKENNEENIKESNKENNKENNIKEDNIKERNKESNIDESIKQNNKESIKESNKENNKENNFKDVIFEVKENITQPHNNKIIFEFNEDNNTNNDINKQSNIKDNINQNYSKNNSSNIPNQSESQEIKLNNISYNSNNSNNNINERNKKESKDKVIDDDMFAWKKKGDISLQEVSKEEIKTDKDINKEINKEIKEINNKSNDVKVKNSNDKQDNKKTNNSPERSLSPKSGKKITRLRKFYIKKIESLRDLILDEINMDKDEHPENAHLINKIREENQSRILKENAGLDDSKKRGCCTACVIF